MADTAEEPLMGHSTDNYEEDVDLTSVSLLLEKNLKNPGIFVWLLTFSAGISGLLFGYDTGVISATLVSINSSLGHPLTTLEKSLITSATALFALLVSPVSGILADKLGRKKVVLLADVAFTLGAVLQAITTSVTGMIAGRAIVGIAVGAGSFVTPLYIAEISPAPFRGRLSVLNILFVTLGQVIAYIVGWAFVQWGDAATGYKWILGLGAVPAVGQMLVMLVMPETPRWLAQVGRRDEARRVLNKVFGAGVDVQRMVDGVLKGIESEVRGGGGGEEGENEGAEAQGSYVLGYRLQGYLGRAFSTVTNFLMTCIALGLIDRVGRRRILLWSIPIMAVGLVFCATGFIFIRMPADLNSENPSSDSARDEIPLSERTAPLLVLVSIMIYVGSYALGLGNVPWMQSELFPLNVRSLGSGLSTSTNWGANFIVGLTFLPMMEFLTAPGTFVIYAIVCIVGWLFIWRIYPETKGLSLEEVGELLANGWGVKESLRRPEVEE
ncbi:Myo-inositol transporter [Lachnellula willkommii]|uniref:Myo-inositol transporter n=1 Tax=Lachnellula willkommii TaxID=215461 RepID=A0A559ME98_9HELO|nr:Myo-inositol transporter [Lachnellula willkommii]